MRWLIMLFLGMALGAGALFTYLREVGDDAENETAAVAAPAVAPAPAPAPAPATPAPAQEELQQAAPAPSADPNAVPDNPDPHLPTGSTSSATPPATLLIPVEGVKIEHLNDTFNQPRGQERRHEALDIMAPKGAKVLAVADGKVAKLFNSKPGGLTVYQFDPSEKFSYYYAHLDRYADNLKEGQQLKRGDLIGYVGVTGNADPNAPHLHFAVFELPATREWWKGKPVNPYPLLERPAGAAGAPPTRP
jgi:murein DD-endopeptidase MepM/ murein hydrolase activator NlpD